MQILMFGLVFYEWTGAHPLTVTSTHPVINKQLTGTTAFQQLYNQVKYDGYGPQRERNGKTPVIEECGLPRADAHTQRYLLTAQLTDRR